MNTSYSGIGMTSQRTRMRMVERLRQQGIRDEIVLSVMGEVPRHLFVEEALADRAYDDVSLPIGFGQTISSPHTVARMTELARARADQGNDGELSKVLEIGTGCGYQCAVLARVAQVVHSVERLVQLTAQARKNLRNARVANARLRHGDGHAGMPTEAPFDVILVAAAATHVPKALREQLALGGRMILPIAKGARGEEQYLLVIDRTVRGFSEKRLDDVKFVPLLPGTG